MMGMKRKGKKVYSCYVRIYAVVLAVLAVCFYTGCGKEEEEKDSAMGRYAERELELPGAGYSEAYLLEDGGCVLGGEKKDVQILSAEGTEKTVNGLWRSNTNINAEIVRALSPAGGMLLAYFPVLSSREYEKLPDEELLEYAYLYIDELGNKHALAPSGEGYAAGTNLEFFAFAPDGKLYASDGGGAVFCMDTESGALRFLFQADSKITEFGFMGNVLIALDTSRAWLYDLDKMALQNANEVLDEFVASHQVKGKSIVLCSGGEEEEILYLGCQTGLYQYVWDGALIEQIADGQLLSFGNSYYTPSAMQALEGGTFRVFFTPGRLVELYYDDTLPSSPDQTLNVYSLEEDARIRYAAQLFQKNHPEVLVKYETGMDGDNAVSREDALKNLNTRLLAGEVPDILVLDGMDIEQYAQKGVLKSLDTLLEPYLEEKLLYENIAEGMRMTDEEHIYALPLTVQIPTWLGERSYMEGESSLEDIVAAYEQARADHPQGALLPVRGEEDFVKKMIFTSLPVWTDEDGSLVQEKLTEFFTALKSIWELNDQGMTEDEWNLLRKYYAKEKGWDMVYPELGDLDWDNDRIWIDMARIRDVGLLNILVNTDIVIYNGDYGLGKTIDVWFGSLNGQAQNIFWAQSIIGICEKAKEPELAEEFYELLLSYELMNKWWMKQGFPINRAAMKWALDPENNEFEQYKGIQDRDKEHWITEEVQQQFLNMIEAASTFYQPGTVLEELAADTGIRVCKGDLTPEQGAAEVASRMAIEMEE